MSIKKDQEFEILIEALRVIHNKTDEKVIDALQKAKDGVITTDNLGTITKWLDPSKNPESGKDSYKVARCLVWYIAKINLKLNDYQESKFPYGAASDAPNKT